MKGTTDYMHKNISEPKSKIKYVHITIIILGIIFISIPIFHQNLWFDESYSVGIASTSFADIWNIGSNDVHPVLYYWILHVFYLLFGSNLYIYRIISMLPLAILGIMGYTYVRKTFGEKVGFLFSFFVLFMPISSVYAGEIRMYTWAMLFVTLMAIYAYKIYTFTKLSKDEKDINKKKFYINWILFAIFSLASAYTHYYGLATAGVINLILFIYLLRIAIKKHKTIPENKANKASRENNKQKVFTVDLKAFTISAVVQILLYLPWVVALLGQIQHVSQGFWINGPSIAVFLQILGFQFTGNLDTIFIDEKIAIGFGIILLVYTIYSMIRAICIEKEKKLTSTQNEVQNKDNQLQETRAEEQAENSSNLPGLWAIGIYMIAMMAMLIISFITPILYARYFLNLTGLFFFFMAFFMAKGGRKVLTILCCILILVVAIFVNYQVAKINYAPINQEPLAYITQDIQEDDLILFGNWGGAGFVTSVLLPEYQNCFFDHEAWNQEKAYQAFGKDMITIKQIEEMDSYEGRIWIVSDSDDLYERFEQHYGDKIQLIKQQGFQTMYHEDSYHISLIEKQAIDN